LLIIGLVALTTLVSGCVEGVSQTFENTTHLVSDELSGESTPQQTTHQLLVPSDLSEGRWISFNERLDVPCWGSPGLLTVVPPSPQVMENTIWLVWSENSSLGRGVAEHGIAVEYNFYDSEEDTKKAYDELMDIYGPYSSKTDYRIGGNGFVSQESYGDESMCWWTGDDSGWFSGGNHYFIAFRKGTTLVFISYEGYCSDKEYCRYPTTTWEFISEAAEAIESGLN